MVANKNLAPIEIKKGGDNYLLKNVFVNKVPERAKKHAESYAKIFKKYGRDTLVKKINTNTYGVYVV